MSRVKKSMKQKMAAFLAVCMTAGSLPTGMVTAAETRERPEDANLAEIIEFDPVKLKDAMEKAVESDKMVTPPTVVASSSEISGFYGAVYELKDAETLLAADAAMPAQTDVRIFLSPQSEGFGEDGKYELTGTEGMVFMIENQGNEDQGYQLLFGNKITDVIEVESKERLLEAYYNPEDLDTATEAEAETVPETTAPAADNAAESGTGESAGETEGSGEVPGTETPETDPVATESETQTVAEVSILDRLLGTLVAYGAEPTATDSENEAFDKTDDGDQPAEPENGSDLPAGETPAESQESTEGETAVTDPATTETVEETEAAEEDKTSEAEEEEEGPRFTAVDDRGYVRLTSGQVSASVLVVKSSFDKIDVEEGMSEPMGVEVTTTRRMAKMANAANGISLMNADDETEAVDDNKLAAVAFYETNAADLLARAGGEGESPFTVNLYDYSGTGKETNPQEINKYLDDHGEEIRFNTQLPNEEPYNAYEYNGKVVNVYQGILDLNAKDPLLGVLFPAEEVSVSADVIDKHLNVNVDDFFEYDENTGTWSYDSDEDWAHYDESSNSLTHGAHKIDETHGVKRTGFWPFEEKDTSTWDETNWNGNNCYFGMSVAFDFYRPEGGIYNNDEMVFSFSGDDDVWVYLTNTDTNETKLVLDLGGIHGAMDGSINFNTGEVTYSNKNALPKERYSQNRYGYTAKPVIYGKECQQQGSGTGTYSTYTDDSLKDFLTSGSNYKLEFFYLERGAGASNCMLNFNLPTIPKQGVMIAKELGGKVTDAERNKNYEFQIVSADILDELKAYRDNPQNGGAVYIYEGISITGANTTSISEAVSGGKYFYIEEINPGTNSVEWRVNREPIKGTTAGNYTLEGQEYYYSPIYQMKEDSESGFLFICRNQFGELKPTVGKTAELVNDKEGVYNITLSVTGDEGTIESGSTSGSVIDMVVVIDKSQSMSKGISGGETYANGVKRAVLDLAKDLSEKSDGKSRIRVVTFGGHGDPGDIIEGSPYYGEDRDQVYYDFVTDWLTLDESTVEDSGFLQQKLNTIRFNEDTHSAGGFLGAKKALEDAGENSHQKVVVYLTDGEPNSFVCKGDKYSYSRRWGWQKTGETYTAYFEQPSAVFVDGFYGSERDHEEYGFKIGEDWIEEDDATYGIDAARTTLRMLKTAYPNVPVYTIGYGSYANGNNSWLKPKSDTESGSDGITKFYPASDADELMKAFEDIYESSSVTTKVVNLEATDVLSKHAEIYDGVTIGGITGPELYLDNVRLIPSAADGTVEYTDTEGNLVAVFTPPPAGEEHHGTITWTVASELGENETRNLTFKVKAVGDYESDTSNYPYMGDSNTGTHSDKKGYYSNGTAELTYGPDRSTEPFPKPVIRPVQQYTSITIEKKVEGENVPSDWKFDFYIGLSDALKDGSNIKKVGENAIPDDLKGYENVYKVTLTNDSSITTISGVPVGAEYQVLETYDSSDDYKVISTSYVIKEKGTTGEEGTENSADDVLTNARNVSMAGDVVTYTNTMGEYSKITLKKVVVDEKGLLPDDSEFTFAVKYKEAGTDSWDVYKEYGDVKLADKKTATIVIDPEDADNHFRIEETDSRNAWKTTYRVGSEEAATEPIELNGVEDDMTVTVTNYYYDHSLNLTKVVEGDELVEGTDYPFTITFITSDGRQLNKDELNVSVSEDNTPVGNKEWTFASNVLIISLENGETLSISKLPQYVTGYEIVENEVIFENEPYKVSLEKIGGLSADKIDLANKKASNTFEDNENRTDSITYTNKYSYQYGSITINKKIEGDRKDSVFTFKITNNQTKEVFYATITGARSTTIEVPIGTYTVEEVDSTVRYEEISMNPENGIVEVSENGPAKVTVTNENTGHNYFSDVNTIVNTVKGGEFVASPDDNPLAGYEAIAASTQTALEMNAGAYLLPNNKIRMQPNNGDEMIQPA